MTAWFCCVVYCRSATSLLRIEYLLHRWLLHQRLVVPPRLCCSALTSLHHIGQTRTAQLGEYLTRARHFRKKTTGRTARWLTRKQAVTPPSHGCHLATGWYSARTASRPAHRRAKADSTWSGGPF